MRYVLLFLAFVLNFNGPARADSPIPDRRVILHRDVDFFGADVQSIFETTLRACESACLANASCQAFTFNTRNGSCFLKREISERTPYDGAFSAEVVPAGPKAVSRAERRAAAAPFLRDRDFAAARSRALDLPHAHVAGGWDLDMLRSSAREAEAAANLVSAMRFAGGAVVLTGEAGDWLEYARLSLAIRTDKSAEQRRYRAQGFEAALNAYLRAGPEGQAANALVVMSGALEAMGRGRDTIPALRLAQALAPRDDTERALDRAIGMFGFRVVGHDVDSDAAIPRICAEFSEPLVKAGVDYAPFVQADTSGLAVEAQGRELCLEGVAHGGRYRVTLRAGLPAASGEELVKPVTLNIYVRDRAASLHFPGRAYVLPKTADAGVPIVTVNATGIDLKLSRVSDRSLIRAVQDSYFARPLSPWREANFEQTLGEVIWQGKGEVGHELNRDVTTRLPLADAIKGQPPGIYVLQASIPGANPYDDPPATQWFVVSDIGIASMKGADGLHVFTRSLGSADPLAGVEVQLVSRGNAVLGSATTDARGYARFARGLTAGRGAAEPAMVVVSQGEDMGFLMLTDPAFDLSDRGVEGRVAAGPIDLFLTTDRGAYRAGEVVHATVLTRDGRAEAIAGLPVTAILYRPDGVEYARHLSDGTAAGAGGHVFSMPVGAAVQRGTWRLDIHSDPDAPALASRTFLIEDFLPERIDFTLALPDGPIRAGSETELSIEARYLFGAPAADLGIEGGVMLRPVQALEGWPGYRFGRHDSDARPEWGNLPYDRKTDANGRAILPVTFPEIDAPGTPLEAALTVSVREGSGRPVERRLSRVLTPQGDMIGIKPLFEDDLPEGAEAAFDVIALGPDMKPADMEIRWTVNRVRTRYQWYRLDGEWNWDPVTTRERVATGEGRLGADPLNLTARLDWGRYELVVEGQGAKYLSSSVDFWAGWYGAADASTTPDMLDVSLDREAYEPGDTAKLRLVPRVPGKALVTVMSNRLIDMKAVEVSAGENIVELPVTDDWGAGVYVTATVIRPMDTAEGRNPTRALGLAHAAVDPGQHRLAAVLELPESASPRAPLDVALKVEGVAPGETVYATIAAVDLGILNLTGFESPDPSGHYFGQRRLGMELRDVYGRLIDGMNGAMGQVRSGGDAGAEMRMQAPPPTEELMAQFSGVLTVGPDGYARSNFDLPAFNGTVRLMAVVWSQTGVGEASADVLVRDPVVVTASLPRFMAPGDTGRMLLEFVHATGPAGAMQLSIDPGGTSVDTSRMPKQVVLTEQGSARFSLPVTAGAVGLQQIEIALTTPDGNRLVKTLNLPVQLGDPEVARTHRFELAADDTFTFSADVFAGFRPGSGKATLTAGPLARLNAPALLELLDRYPYGCTEQTTSRALPLLYFGAVAEALGLEDREDVPGRITRAIDRVLSNQASDGGFGLWGAYSGDFWLDAYVTDFLSRARAQGYRVPDAAFRQALDNLRNQVNYASDFENGGEALAYALYVLAREGAAAMGDLRYFADQKGGDFATPLAQAQLGAALAAYGDPTRADAMFARAARAMAAVSGAEAQLWRADYGSRNRDAAAVLALAIEAGSAAIDRNRFASRIAAHEGRLSTQEATWTLMAAHALIGEAADSGLTVNGEAVAGPMVRVLDAQTETAPLAIRNGGTRDVALTLTTFGVPDVPEPAGGRGYTLERHYFTLEGDPADVAEVKRGARLVNVLTVKPHGKSDGRLVVNDPLPAGFEIDNPNILRAGDIRALDWLKLDASPEHTEFRQDRFIAAIDWRKVDVFRLAYIVRAISPGDYHHPAALVEDMYRPDYRAITDTGRVRITE